MKTYAIATKEEPLNYWAGGSYRLAAELGEAVTFPTEEEAAHELATWPEEIRTQYRVVSIKFDVERDTEEEA
jgi:hypothetical protein